MSLVHPIHTERHIRIICIGAGASSLLFAYKLQRSFNNFSLIFAYFDSFAAKYGLRQYCRLKHQIVHAAWSTDITRHHHGGGYDFVDTCDILINAGGVLNSWRSPAIPFIEKFRGTLVHTANWDDRIVLEGKHVGLIGKGAILPEVRKVTTFIREPTWVSLVQGLEQHIFTVEEKRAFAEDPAQLTEYRRAIESGMNGQWAVFLRHSESQRSTRDYMAQQMKEKLRNPQHKNLLIPEWSVGCRRITITPGVGYLESLGHEKTQVVYGNIDAINENGCICDDGKEYPVDVLICATGFDTSFRPRFPIIRPAGNKLQDDWQHEPQSYLGIAAAGIPNYLTFLGPNSPVGNGPVLSAIEAQADYMMKLIDRYQTTNIRAFAPRPDAVRKFIEFKNQLMQRTSTLHYIEAMSEVCMDDWEVEYNGSRLAWLGNGEYHSRGKRLRILSKSGTRKPESTAFTVFPSM
ncbi:hypothetical protein BJY01DRAFT_256656 [Aspergillus pseudoustus]|uniref:FAD/NAD(P)-binding domain-containing protein n=1 Tax=Aspergillus pseudoustus TaxID=1810923 RepID=A0ABR4L4R1_9EURO